jgi:DNA-binding transcriptional LysR family regulator
MGVVGIGWCHPAHLIQPTQLPASQAPAHGGQVVPQLRLYLESNLGDSLRDAALAGLGIALHSTWHVCEDLRAGRLEVVLPDYPVADTGIYTVMPQRRLVPPRVRAFTDFLADWFGETAPWQEHGKPGLTTAATPRHPRSNSRTPRRSSR